MDPGRGNAKAEAVAAAETANPLSERGGTTASRQAKIIKGRSAKLPWGRPWGGLLGRRDLIQIWQHRRMRPTEQEEGENARVTRYLVCRTVVSFGTR